MFDGPAGVEEFHRNGLEFLEIYRNLCSLSRRGERVLDVGSGIGRKTLQLTSYFEADASYVGIDTSAKGIEWCNEHIASRFPNFTFTHVDVANRLYNPSGRVKPCDFRFPFGDRSFTFVMLGSVFTHMMPPDVVHYLSEVARVLEPGKRCLISYFLLNDESRALLSSGGSELAFRSASDGYATTSPEVPERAVAFEESFVTRLYRDAGLQIERVEYGSWCGRQRYMSYQDLILATKYESNA
jgi:SAM-dependent methyltransferase